MNMAPTINTVSSLGVVIKKNEALRKKKLWREYSKDKNNISVSNLQNKNLNFKFHEMFDK